MTKYKQGDVVLIPFPFTDLSTVKQRPAVIVSSTAYNNAHQDVIICAITSRIPTHIEEFDHKLSDIDIVSAGLLKNSLIKCDKVITLDRRLIRKTLGHIPGPVLRELIYKFTNIFNG